MFSLRVRLEVVGLCWVCCVGVGFLSSSWLLLR